MRRVSVAYLPADPRPQGEAMAVSQLGFKLAFQAQDDVPFGAPVVGAVSGGVFHHAHANVSHGLRAPERETGLSRMLGSRNLAPIGD